MPKSNNLLIIKPINFCYTCIKHPRALQVTTGLAFMTGTISLQTAIAVVTSISNLGSMMKSTSTAVNLASNTSPLVVNGIKRFASSLSGMYAYIRYGTNNNDQQTAAFAEQSNEQELQQNSSSVIEILSDYDSDEEVVIISQASP